jgi:hypothetical protein
MPVMQSLKAFSSTSATTLDVGAGALYYDATPDKKSQCYLVVHLFYINKPKDPIVYSQSVDLNTIPLRFTLHGGVSFNLSTKPVLSRIYYICNRARQKKPRWGTYVKYNVNQENRPDDWSLLPVKDAIAPFIGV